MDAKDILGLPKNALLNSQEKKAKPPKEPQRKPDGISREVISFFFVFFLGFGECLIFSCFCELQVYMLTGGVAPLMPAIDASQLKKRPPTDEKVCVSFIFVTMSFKFGFVICKFELYYLDCS